MQTKDIQIMKKKMFPGSPETITIIESEKNEVLLEERVIRHIKKSFAVLEERKQLDTNKYLIQFVGVIRIKELKDK